MAVWAKLLVFMTSVVATSGTNQNDCMTALLDVTAVFRPGNISSPSLAEHLVESNTSCTDRCCQSELCNIATFRVSSSAESPNCFLYSCHPTNSCYLASADNRQIYIRQQPQELPTPTTPGAIDFTSSAPGGDVSTDITTAVTSSSSAAEGQAGSTTDKSRVQTSPLTPPQGQPQEVVADNSGVEHSETLSPLKQSSDTPTSGVKSTNSPASGPPDVDSPSSPSSDAPSSPSSDSPSSPSSDAPSSPSSDSPSSQSSDAPSSSSSDAPSSPSSDAPSSPSSESPSSPSSDSPSSPSSDSLISPSIDSDSPNSPSTNLTNLLSTDSSSQEPDDTSHTPTTATSPLHTLSTQPPDNTITSANLPAQLTPTVTTAATTNSPFPHDPAPSDPSFSFSLSPVSSNATNSPLSAVTSPLSAVTSPLSAVTSPLSAVTSLEHLKTPESLMTSDNSTAVLDGLATLTAGNEQPGTGKEMENSSSWDTSIMPSAIATVISLAIAPTVTSPASTTPEAQSREAMSHNATSSTNDLLPHGTSEAMLAILVSTLTFGCVFLLTVVAVLGKRVYDGYQKRHYSRLDYLINGMYN